MHQTQSSQEWQKFVTSCTAAGDFPKNLVYPAAWYHTLQAYVERLEVHQTRLFQQEGDEAQFHLLEYDSPQEGFQKLKIGSTKELQMHVNSRIQQNEADPRCRFVFVHARSSRDTLRVSREMFSFTLTYLQVLPSFLDFIFCFGKTQYARDFHFSGFRWANRVSVMDMGLRLPELNRSGRDIQMCYSLKSVEPAKGASEDMCPWSIRLAAVYHSFDVETGTAVWIIVKADQTIRKRLESASSPGPGASSRISSFASNSNAFAASLSTHLFLCDCSGEGWRWYIDYLEEEFQRKTRPTLWMEIPSPSVPNPASPNNFSERRSFMTSAPEGLPRIPSVTPQLPTTLEKQTQRKRPPLSPPSALQINLSSDFNLGQGPVSFKSLQEIQFIEEKASEVLLVMDANINVLKELKQEYEGLLESEDCPQALKRDCKSSMENFGNRIKRAIGDFLVVRSRGENLLKLVADRKEFLHGILQFINMDANSRLAREAHGSAQRMEKMTENMRVMTSDMNSIAQVTKRETVSMRIITLVTLFFLPGTFISTIMSTDIIHFQSTEGGGSGRIFESQALELYFEITVPLMLLTFGAWFGVYKWENYKDLKAESKNNQDSFV